MPTFQAGNIKIQAGDVIKVTANFTNPPKEKIMICICPIKFKYMVINTKPYGLARPAQLPVSVTELPCLDHNSHIDTSKLVTLSAMETQYVVDSDERCHKGPLPPKLKQSIKALILQHRIMPKDQMNLVAQNL